jgi:hypothetical protein
MAAMTDTQIIELAELEDLKFDDDEPVQRWPFGRSSTPRRPPQ